MPKDKPQKRAEGEGLNVSLWDAKRFQYQGYHVKVIAKGIDIEDPKLAEAISEVVNSLPENERPPLSDPLIVQYNEAGNLMLGLLARTDRISKKLEYEVPQQNTSQGEGRSL